MVGSRRRQRLLDCRLSAGVGGGELCEQSGITLRRNTKQATYAWLSRAIAELDSQEQITLFKAGELFKRMAEKP